ncbi:MAG: hypothetical protein ACKO2P_12475, partial [Planctomycetota bacterium]
MLAASGAIRVLRMQVRLGDWGFQFGNAGLPFPSRYNPLTRNFTNKEMFRLNDHLPSEVLLCCKFTSWSAFEDRTFIETLPHSPDCFCSALFQVVSSFCEQHSLQILNSS